MKWILPIMALASAAVVGYAIGRSDESPVIELDRQTLSSPLVPSPPVGRSHDPATRAAIVELHRKIEALEGAIAAARPEDDAADAVPAPSPASAAPSIEEVDLALGERLVNEPTDRAWSEGTEARIEAAFAEIVPQGATLLDVDCRTSMCRLESEYEAGETFEEFLAAAPHREPFIGESFFRQSNADRPDEPPRFVWYVAREGHRLRDHLVDP